MIKILSSEQIKKADEYTIQHEPIASIDLMERAANAFVTQFEKDFPDFKNIIHIFCGNGNNGGDGFAIARILKEKNYTIICYGFEGDKSNDCNINFNLIENVITINKSTIINIDKKDIVFDALFGIGLNKAVEGIYLETINTINQTNATTISVDVPSGMMVDVATNGTMIKANKTYSFQSPKLAFYLPHTANHVGDLTILDIQLDKKYIQELKSTYFEIDDDFIFSHYKKRNRFSHKGTYGHALISCGSFGKIGAAILSAKACLKTGAGLLTVNLPQKSISIIHKSIPEAMCLTHNESKYIEFIPYENQYNAYAIGCGIGTHQKTYIALSKFLEHCKQAIVLDADALNIIAEHQSLLEKIPVSSILTPHPKEFERLVGAWQNDFERLEKAKQFAKQYQLNLILKDAITAIIDKNGMVCFNTFGNAGMATAGSGDVLTGIITSLLAQEYSPLTAAIFGVYIHAKAGDFAKEKLGEESMLASDIIENIYEVFKCINSNI
ncbi:MAG: NAD(P)H-hydrate dehydratase [Chitinophagales bacterium]|nr:NAD(P)H-hydrate dehydratase [Chitinophagales bacterium]